MKAVFLLALLLAQDGGAPVASTRVVECHYAGYCCQFDWIGKSGCRVRLLCDGHRTEKLRDGKVIDPGVCK